MKQILFLKEYGTYNEVDMKFESVFNLGIHNSLVFIDCSLYTDKDSFNKTVTYDYGTYGGF